MQSKKNHNFSLKSIKKIFYKMLKFNHLLLTIIFCACGIILHAQEKITLNEAIEIALSESNTIKIADMTIEMTG